MKIKGKPLGFTAMWCEVSGPEYLNPPIGYIEGVALALGDQFSGHFLISEFVGSGT